ncbi:formimidoylglutamase [Nocardiopsis coralliicola]
MDPPAWTGRDDGPGPEHDRWHRRIRPAGGTAAPGAVLQGFASDEGVRRNSGRPGAAAGPAALRGALAPLALHHRLPLYDAGDIAVDDGDLEAGQEAAGAGLAAARAGGHLPVHLGGGHETAYAAYLGAARAGRTLGVLNLDAHFDLREAPRATSGTGFLQMARAEAERGHRFRYFALGIAAPSNTRALFDRAAELGAEYLPDTACTPGALGEVLAAVQAFTSSVDDVLLTLDLDVLPGYAAPGVSAPAALGVAPEVVLAVVDAVAASGRLALFDVAELNPALDADGRTARLAARMIDRAVSGWCAP